MGDQVILQSIAMTKRQQALDVLREKLWDRMFPHDVQKAKELIEKYGPSQWIEHIYDTEAESVLPGRTYPLHNPHSAWGLQVRNLMRESGVGEQFLGVEDLQEVYAELLAEALPSCQWY